MGSNHFQSIQFIGRLGRDPVDRISTTGGDLVVEFSVCIENYKKNKDGDISKALLWINVHTSGKIARACKSNLSKGRLVFISGSLLFDDYGNPYRANDDYKTPRFDVNAEIVKFLDPANKPDPDNRPVQPELKLK